MSDADLDVGSKQALVTSFEELARCAVRMTNRDPRRLGVLPEHFTVQALEESVVAEANARLFHPGPPSPKALLAKARRSPTTFLFLWRAPGFPEPLQAAFELSFERRGLRNRLLWLGLPEKVPISPRVGIIDGRVPLEEAVTEVLRVRPDGGIEQYPPPV